MPRFLYALFAVGVVCLGGCKSSSSSSSTTTPTTPTTPGAPTILTFTAVGTLTMNSGDSRQLKAVALMSDGSTQILTTGVSWSSSDPTILTVDTTGIVTAAAAGAASVVVASGNVKGTVQVTVVAGAASGQEFIGTVAAVGGAGPFSATADLVASPTTVASGSLYSGLTSVSAFGRLDPAANVLNVVAGSYTLLGTIRGAVITGTSTDASGNVGAFSGVDGTHAAVTTYCGSYTASDGTTGPFNLAASVNGTAAASAAQLRAGGAAAAFSGTLAGSSLSLSSPGGVTAAGSLTSGVMTGTVQGGGAAGSFTASATACR